MSLQTTASADAAARGIDWLASDGLPAGVEVDRHRIERVLGRGGMAIVYEATQLLLQRRVALKLLSGSPSGEMELQMRFWQEALLQANLSHPNIVEVYEVGTAHAGAYITMRLIRGQSAVRSPCLSRPLGTLISSLRSWPTMLPWSVAAESVGTGRTSAGSNPMVFAKWHAAVTDPARPVLSVDQTAPSGPRAVGEYVSGVCRVEALQARRGGRGR